MLIEMLGDTIERCRRPAIRWLVIAAVVALVLAGCGGDDDGDSTPTPTINTSPSPENCAPNREVTLGGIEWSQIFPGQVYEEQPWRVLRGQGEGPFVGVSLNMEVVGAIELRQSELEGDFSPAEGIAALEAWAADLYAQVESERSETYGDDYVFERGTPAPVNIGTLCAISFGYTGTDGDTQVDRLAGFATFDLGHLYLFVAEYDAARAPDAGFADAQTLADFEPVFGRFVPQLTLPPGAAAPEQTPTPEATPDGAAPTE